MGVIALRFILLVKATKESEAGELPGDEVLAAMRAYHERLASAGVLVDSAGIHESSTGARVDFSGGTTSVTEGPFGNVEDQVCGYWVLDVGCRDDAIDWARRVPFHDGQIEVRKIIEPDDYCGSTAL